MSLSVEIAYNGSHRLSEPFSLNHAMEKSIVKRWQLKEFVFAAFMTIALAITAKLTYAIGIALPLPGATVAAWAPLGALFLTLGMARLRSPGAVALIVGVLAILLGLLNWTVAVNIGSGILVAEIAGLLAGGFANKIGRLAANVGFFSTACAVGAITGAVFLGKIFAERMAQPLLLIPTILLTAALAGIGWWLGEAVVVQLQRAGKLGDGE